MRTILILVVLFITSCNRKEEKKSLFSEKISAQKFDLKAFEKKAKIKRAIKDGRLINVRESELIKNDSIFKWEEEENTFYEEKIKDGEKFKKISNYNKTTLFALNNSTLFCNIAIGITKIYSDKGQIVKEINNDENYPFSIYDLIIKIKKSHNIDLNKGLEVRGVNRYFDTSFNKFIYSINYKDNLNPAKYIIVDAKNGKILKEGLLTIVI
jgi:hypothetical protein